jgi:hypothetical protein
MKKVDIIWSWNSNVVWGEGSYGNPRMRSFGSMNCMNLPHEMRVSLTTLDESSFEEAGFCTKALLSLM